MSDKKYDPDTTSPARKWIFRAVALCLPLTALIAAISAAEHWASFHTSLPGQLMLDDSRLNHVYPTNHSHTYDSYFRDDSAEPFLFERRTNSQGWRENYDIPLEKPDSVYRIFYVGDSFTEGTAPVDSSVPELVEKELNSGLGGSGIRYEVINTGTSSYSPTIFYVLVRYYLLSYSPDLIVINVDMTDDYDDWKYSSTLVTDGGGNPYAASPREIYEDAYIDTRDGARKATFMSRVYLYFYENSYLFNYLRKKYPKLRFPMNIGTGDKRPESGFIYPRWAWCGYDWDEKTAENAARTLDYLGRTLALCRERGVKAAVTGVPHYEQFAVDLQTGKPRWSDRPHREIAGIAKKFGALYIDSFNYLKPLISGTPRTKYYYRGDMHFNPAGYRLWSRAHIYALTSAESNLLPLR